jgi:hypothetical protein
VFSKALIRPFKLFASEPIIQLLGVYIAFIYGVFYRKPSLLAFKRHPLSISRTVFLTTMPSIFANVYNEGPGIQGLHYIALGIGLAICSQMNAILMDKIYIYFKRKNGNVGEPEFRLPSMVPGTIILPIGLFIAGWASQAKVHWIVTDIVSLGLNPRVTFNSDCPFYFTGHRVSRRGDDPRVPIHADIRRGCVHTARCIRYIPRFHPFLSLNANGTFGISSSGSRIMFARSRWVRLPAFRHPNVQQAWLREGRHRPRMREYSAWMPRVRFSLPLQREPTNSTPRPFLFWKYGRRIRMNSKYAHRSSPQHHPEGQEKQPKTT